MSWGVATEHAVLRYQERVAPVSIEEALEALNTPTIKRAIELGARAVKLGTGHRAVLYDGKVVTVQPKRARYSK